MLTEGKQKTNRKIYNEDLEKSLTHNRQRPTTKPPSRRPESALESVEKINVLSIDENSILVVHVCTGNMHASQIDSFVKKTASTIKSTLKNKNIEIMICPYREKDQMTKFEVIKKEQNDKN